MIIPVALFTYIRLDYLEQTLNCLRENNVPLIYAFSDGPKNPEHYIAVEKIRELLRKIDWCEVILTERKENLGLGLSILTGVSDVLQHYDSVIVFEDDLICVPGTYNYLCDALRHYNNVPEVMSVSGWTHPTITPEHIGKNPYFDGRAECWVWGTWARSWEGMDRSALQILEECNQNGLDIYRYGADLPIMAEQEKLRNIWAVRWLYLHILRRKLCLRPPYSLVEHIGVDLRATNVTDGERWKNSPLRSCPPIPAVWPVPSEHPDCSMLWQQAYGKRPSTLRRIIQHIQMMIINIIRQPWLIVF